MHLPLKGIIGKKLVQLTNSENGNKLNFHNNMTSTEKSLKITE